MFDVLTDVFPLPVAPITLKDLLLFRGGRDQENTHTMMDGDGDVGESSDLEMLG
jgi:hypothetical protein